MTLDICLDQYKNLERKKKFVLLSLWKCDEKEAVWLHHAFQNLQFIHIPKDEILAMDNTFETVFRDYISVL